MSTSGVEPIIIGPWTLLPHVDATRAAYAQVDHGGAEDCRCEPCANWMAVRERAFPADVRALFTRLGVDWRKEAEAAHTCRVEGGHFYLGWLHCIAEWIEGPETGAAVPFGDRFDLCLSRSYAPMLAPFSGQSPLVQLVFTATVPWVLAVPEPD